MLWQALTAINYCISSENTTGEHLLLRASIFMKLEKFDDVVSDATQVCGID